GMMHLLSNLTPAAQTLFMQLTWAAPLVPMRALRLPSPATAKHASPDWQTTVSMPATFRPPQTAFKAMGLACLMGTAFLMFLYPCSRPRATAWSTLLSSAAEVMNEASV